MDADPFDALLLQLANLQSGVFPLPVPSLILTVMGTSATSMHALTMFDPSGSSEALPRHRSCTPWEQGT